MTITLNCQVFEENNIFKIVIEEDMTFNSLKDIIVNGLKGVNVNVSAVKLKKFNLWKVDGEHNINNTNLLNEHGVELPPFSNISEHFPDELEKKHHIIIEQIKDIAILCDGTWNSLSTKLLKNFKFSFLNGILALDLDNIIYNPSI